MTCKNCSIKPVWEFTNQTKLCKKCFSDYIERKVFRTIRKEDMLSGNSVELKKEDNINYILLRSILQSKFNVVDGNKLNSENLSDFAEKDFLNIIKGDFSSFDMGKSPLCFVSDAELEVYAKIVGLKGKKKLRDKRVQELFSRFMKKNPDLEINIVKAMGQLKDVQRQQEP